MEKSKKNIFDFDHFMITQNLPKQMKGQYYQVVEIKAFYIDSFGFIFSLDKFSDLLNFQFIINPFLQVQPLTFHQIYFGSELTNLPVYGKAIPKTRYSLQIFHLSVNSYILLLSESRKIIILKYLNELHNQ